MATRGTAGRFVKVVEEPPEPPAPATREELLTVEAHPVLGRIERWRMSDGTVSEVRLRQVFVE